MSESIPKTVNDESNINPNVEEKNEDKFVPRKAYQTVSADMMKYKEEKKNLQAELEKLRADEQARIEAEQLRNGEFQKLADTYKQKYEEAEAARKADRQRVNDLHKLHTLEKEIGGFRKSEYAKVAVKLENIKLDENGLVDPESLKNEVTRIRQEHPFLLNTAEKGTLPNNAPEGPSDPISYNQAVKNCKTREELTELMKKHGRL